MFIVLRIVVSVLKTKVVTLSYFILKTYFAADNKIKVDIFTSRHHPPLPTSKKKQDDLVV